MLVRLPTATGPTKVEIAERACFFLVDDVPLGEMFGDDMLVMTGGFRE